MQLGGELVFTVRKAAPIRLTQAQVQPPPAPLLLPASPATCTAAIPVGRQCPEECMAAGRDALVQCPALPPPNVCTKHCTMQSKTLSMPWHRPVALA